VLFGPKGHGATWHQGRNPNAFGKVAAWFGDLWN